MMHAKLAVQALAESIYKVPSSSLNVVFKPGAFGGQLMANSLNSALQHAHSQDPSLQPSSQQSYFLGPTLIDKDVYFKVDTVRESGRSFVTKRVSSFQLDEGEDISAGLSRPPNFESTVDFYRPSPKLLEATEEADLNFSKVAEFTDVHSTEDIISSSIPLSELKALLVAKELERGSLYGMAVFLADKLSLADMLLDIRVPKTALREPAGSRSSYWVGVDAGLCAGLDTPSQGKVILPYVSDGMTQVLACFSALNGAKGWDAWPSKLTVWN
jgi:hypothetical protein